MSEPNESPAPVVAGREAFIEDAAKPLDTNNLPPDVNPGPAQGGAMSWFDSVTGTHPTGSTTADELWDRIRSPEFSARIDQIRGIAIQMASSTEGSKAWKQLKGGKDLAKKRLPAVTISGFVTSGGRAHAGEDGRLVHSGYLQVDLDGKDHPGKVVSQLVERLKQDAHIQHVALSPSGDGVKALCRIGRVETREGVDADLSLPTHKDAYACAEKYFVDLGLKLDPSCRDPARLCYVTHDSDAWSRAERAVDLPITKGADALRGKTAGESGTAKSASATDQPDGGCDKWARKGFILDDLREMLAAIGPQELAGGIPGKYSDYSEWLKIVNAAIDGFGAAAIPHLENWRPSKKGELEEMARPKKGLKRVKFPTLIKFAQDCGWVNPHKSEPNLEIPSDVFPVPGGEVSISTAAETIFSVIAPTHTMFIRETTVHELVESGGEKAMRPVYPDRLCSRVEGYGSRVSRLKVVEKDGEKTHSWIPSTFANANAAKLLATDEARKLLPPLRQFVACPIITPDGSLDSGYHAHAGGTMIQSSKQVPELHLDLALSFLNIMLDGFAYASPSDRSRAAAHLISLALKMGGWISDDYPLFVVEADQSQAGKSYFLKLVAALYNEVPNPIVFAKGGVGSCDESVANALVRGRLLITFENVRGKLDSPLAESAIRGVGKVPCRTLRKSTEVDPTAFLFQLSTNGAELTVDLANRSLITCIRKHPPEHSFTEYPEGDLLAYVKSMQPVFLGAVFAIIREWQRLGCQRTAETRHDFRGFCQAADWIVQNILKLPPLLDGHREKQLRTSDDRLVWLRNVVMEIEHEDELGQIFTASRLAEFAENHGFPVPPPNGKAEAKHRLGILMAGLLRKAGGDVLHVEGYSVIRSVETKMDECSRARDHKTYRIEKGGAPA